MSNIEFLKLYPYSQTKYYSRVGNPLNGTDYLVFFKSEADMVAYDNWNNSPPPNSQELMDRGRNLATIINTQLNDVTSGTENRNENI